ncbi:short-subunit dehydrogenase [Luteimonas cucumeris]|uniref:Short-subunit dehydrogenase n=1 Tax=Luteimonas cucumeris TaxID=985012 RepID=A0A562KWB6_9GAMM|nr:SDR family NAD(P)-dependent oxidoreductase [Luteimonas cucumeris]TWH99719.1 short-subunit dehydrogenase [Luteimonas cucumeris]
MRAALIVLGATGEVGRGVVQAALERAWPVIAVARDGEALDALRRQHAGADLVAISASLDSEAAATRLGDELRALGRPLGGVVATICGGCKRGRLLDQPAEFLRRTLDEDLLPHLVAARQLLPLLAASDRGGGYVLIGGPGGEQPWAGYGHDSIAAAALRMLARVLHDEARAYPVRVQLLAVESPLRTEANRRHACTQWPNALAVGQRALALIEHSAVATPAHAVVRYTAPLAESPWSDDIDLPATPANALTSSSVEHASAAAQKAQAADSEAGLLPPRCLQDARKLLQTLALTKRNQESSPR